MTSHSPSSQGLRIVFAGTPDFAAAHLEKLIESHNIVGVYTQPDRPANRGKKLKASPVKELALKHDLPVFQPNGFKEESAKKTLADLNPDVFIVVAYGVILPQAVLDIPTFGCINVHGSLLPKWRGAAPIQRAIEAGDSETGVTIMQMDKGLDTGDMLLKTLCPISTEDTSATIYARLAEQGPEALNQVIAKITDGTLSPEKQDDASATYADKITKEEALIDWTQDADVIQRRVCAFNPSPTAYTTIGNDRLKIWNCASNVSEAFDNITPGTIIEAGKKSIVVACGKGSLTLNVIQLPGKKAMETAAILNSRRELFNEGTILGQ